MRKNLFLLLSVLSYAGVGSAAGFDCAKATTQVERAICADTELSELDEHLGRYYEGFKFALPGNETCIKTDQLRWLKSVRNACRDNACRKKAYLNRLSELDGFQLGATAIKYINLPNVPTLVRIIPPVQEIVAPRQSKTSLELIGNLGWAEDGSDVYVIKTKSGASYFLDLPGLIGVKIDRFPEFAEEQWERKNSTFRMRGEGKLEKGVAYFDPSHCVFFHRMPQ